MNQKFAMRKEGEKEEKGRVVKSKVVYKRMTRHCCSRREWGLAEGRKRRVELETRQRVRMAGWVGIVWR